MCGPGVAADEQHADNVAGREPAGNVFQLGDRLRNPQATSRLCEIRMLFYVGKDLERWSEQCVDFASRETSLSSLARQSFAGLLIENPPSRVREKLIHWGVVDFRAIFSRALGLHAVFAAPPDAAELNPNFIRNYFRYADQLYECRRSLSGFPRISSEEFDFDLWASGEYSRMLERQWAES